MSAKKRIHTILAGDIEAALVHKLTVKAVCGLVFVPSTKRKKGIEKCSGCERLSRPGPKPSRADNLPHYVYRHYSAEGVLLYVGCTVDPKTRSLGHQQNSWWFSQSARVRLTIYPNRLHALRVERDAIAAERPLWNVRHQNFASWPHDQLHLGHALANAEVAPDPVVRRFKKLAGDS